MSGLYLRGRIKHADWALQLTSTLSSLGLYMLKGYRQLDCACEVGMHFNAFFDLDVSCEALETNARGCVSALKSNMDSLRSPCTPGVCRGRQQTLDWIMRVNSDLVTTGRWPCQRSLVTGIPQYLTYFPFKALFEVHDDPIVHVGNPTRFLCKSEISATVNTS